MQSASVPSFILCIVLQHCKQFVTFGVRLPCEKHISSSAKCPEKGSHVYVLDEVFATYHRVRTFELQSLAATALNIGHGFAFVAVVPNIVGTHCDTVVYCGNRRLVLLLWMAQMAGGRIHSVSHLDTRIQYILSVDLRRVSAGRDHHS